MAMTMVIIWRLAPAGRRHTPPLLARASGLANFIGDRAWSIWMVGFGTWLLRHPVAVGAQEPRHLRS